MNAAAVGISVAGFLIVMGTWATYLASIPKGTVPVKPIGSVLLQWLGIALAVGAAVWSYRETGSFAVAVIVPGALAVMMAAFFLWLLSQRKTPIGDITVKVGDRLPPFAVKAAEGTSFDTGELAGKRTLLKFFRGGW